MTKLAWIVYAIILVAGTALIMQRREDQVVPEVATRTLPAGHLLTSGDIKIPAGYLRRRIEMDSPILKEDVGAMPQFSPRIGHIAVAVPLPRRTVEEERVNSDTVIRLCSGGKPVAEGVQARLVICSPAEPQCMVIVDVPVESFGGDSGASFVKALGDVSRLDVRLSKRNCG